MAEYQPTCSVFDLLTTYLCFYTRETPRKCYSTKSNHLRTPGVRGTSVPTPYVITFVFPGKSNIGTSSQFVNWKFIPREHESPFQELLYLFLMTTISFLCVNFCQSLRTTCRQVQSRDRLEIPTMYKLPLLNSIKSLREFVSGTGRKVCPYGQEFVFREKVITLKCDTPNGNFGKTEGLDRRRTIDWWDSSTVSGLEYP